MKRTAVYFGAACLMAASVLTVCAATQKTSQPAQQPEASLNNPATVASGQKIYAKQCEICHFSKSRAKKIGPGLANIYSVGKFANGKRVDDASMRVWIEMGGKDMPGYRDLLKPTEIRDLIAYLRTL